jgi:hypothetical protein
MGSGGYAGRTRVDPRGTMSGRCGSGAQGTTCGLFRSQRKLSLERTLMRHFHQQNAYRTKSPRTYGVSASDHPPRCPVRRALNLRRLSVVSNPPNR